MDVRMHDGSHLRIRKLTRDYDPTDRIAALATLEDASAKGEVLTGVLYVNPEKPTFVDLLNMDDAPLATQPESRTRPGKEVLDQVMEELR
jgi:2-oxoglutarate/2-oxoacid ferredoxin oxidoreductase subunit beta